MNKKIISGSITSLFLLASCGSTPTNNYPIKQCGNQEKSYTKYEACDLDSEKGITNLVQTLYDFNPKELGKHTILWLNGGPQKSFTTKVLTKGYDDKKYYEKLPKAFQNYLDYTKKLGDEKKAKFFMVNQSQWLKQEKFKNSKNFDLKNSRLEALETVKRVHKIAKFLKDKNKSNPGWKITLGGESYGAQLVNLYLSEYGEGLFDRVVSVSGRLNIATKEKIMKKYKENKFVFFGENDSFIEEKDFSKNEEKSIGTLGIDLMTDDFTKLITAKTLNKTVFYSSTLDKHIGWFNNSEINWARSKGAKVKLYSKQEVEKAFNDFKAKNGGKFVHGMGTSIQTFAHLSPIWSYEMYKEINFGN